MSEDTIFQIASLLTIAFAVAIFTTTLVRARVHPSIAGAVTALYVFNPYLARLPLSFSGLIDHPVFVLGLGMVTLAVTDERDGLLIGGSVIAALGRQTAMTFLPAFVLLGLARRRWTALLTSFMMVLAVYFGTGMIATSFARASVNQAHLTGVFRDWTKVGVLAFLSYYSECAIPIVAALLLLTFLRDFGSAFSQLIDDRRHAVLTLLALGVLASPVLMGPTIGHGSGSRLSALALPAILIVIAFMLDTAGAPFVRSPAFLWGVSICAFVGSLHHIFTVYRISRWQFGVLTLVSWFGIAALGAVAHIQTSAAGARHREPVN